MYRPEICLILFSLSCFKFTFCKNYLRTRQPISGRDSPRMLRGCSESPPRMVRGWSDSPPRMLRRWSDSAPTMISLKSTAIFVKSVPFLYHFCTIFSSYSYLIRTKFITHSQPSLSYFFQKPNFFSTRILLIGIHELSNYQNKT